MQRITLYNALTRRKEFFHPLRPGRVGLYTCGPTVYNYAHIGNLRTYIFEDLLRRVLEYAGYSVRHVMNITDVDDKIIRDAARAGKTIFDFVKPYEKSFFDDLKKLNIEPAWKYAKATEHIADMVRLIRALLKKEIAYPMDGSVYFSIKKFKAYGKLSRVSSRRLRAGARVDADEYAKQDVQDFALWKAKKEGEPSWTTPFGEGRPGWHIECSAMAMKYLGATLDIHAGGVDLIFPHHENEIAQSEGATGKTFARFFMEGEHLLVNGEKMSKSLGNVFTLRDIESRLINPLALRYLALTAHYRGKLNFTWDSLAAAEQSRGRMMEFARDLKSSGASRARDRTSRASSAEIKKYKAEFNRAIFDDLNIPKALAVVWRLIRQYRKKPEAHNARQVSRVLFDFDAVLGLGLKEVAPNSVSVPIEALVRLREQYREEKNWRKADEARKKIEAAGYLIQDSADGAKIKKRV